MTVTLGPRSLVLLRHAVLGIARGLVVRKAVFILVSSGFKQDVDVRLGGWGPRMEDLALQSRISDRVRGDRNGIGTVAGGIDDGVSDLTLAGSRRLAGSCLEGEGTVRPLERSAKSRSRHDPHAPFPDRRLRWAANVIARYSGGVV
ncbi:hypothetical protein DXG01_001968 [Tephrocybe rancida]|nr:hypothetical protein DXG01_001968 [Tephrocybe rancida]